MPIKVARSDQACALGSAMAASVVAGIHSNISEAQKAMGGGFEKVYHPDPGRAAVYDSIYKNYKKVGAFIEELTGNSRD